MGPSGVGKDTVIAALSARRPALHVVRRVITRPAEAGGEPYMGVSGTEFARRVRATDFLLHWHAHGLDYGIPRDVLRVLEDGHDALVNLSRNVLADAWVKVPSLLVLSLTAPAAVLARRLADRGRETDADIAERLKRRHAPIPPGLPVIEIDNSGALDETVGRILAALDAG